MAEHADRLAAGATPVLVEGPIDALAITLTSADHVGVAPLGTALTDTQADTLLPYLDTAAGAPGVTVATDPDLAGQLAAERTYWMLTARGADPRHATLPPGQDPADLLHSTGPTALRQHLQNARALADTLIDERLGNLPPAAALTAALQVVAAGHAQHWSARTADIARRLHAPEDVALTELLGHIRVWDKDRQEASTRQIRDVPTARDRITALANQKPAQRWAPLARQIDPALTRAHDWGALAEAIDRSHRAGDDVQTLLPHLAAQAPLSKDEPAKDLRYRLAARLDDPEEPMARHSTPRITGPRLDRPPATQRTPTPRRARDSGAPGR